MSVRWKLGVAASLVFMLGGFARNIHAGEPEPVDFELRGVLAKVLPAELGRVPTRRISRGETFAVRRAIALLFNDKPPNERQALAERVLNVVRNTAPVARHVDSNVSKRLIDIIARAIEESSVKAAEQDADGATRAALTAASALGWTYRILGAARLKTADVESRRKLLVYATHFGLFAVNVAGLFAVDTWFGVPAVIGQVLATLVLVIDVGEGQELANFMGRAFFWVNGDQSPREISRREAKFWFDLEQRLSKNAEWRDWVKLRAHRGGADGIASDVIERVRELTGGKSAGSICERLLEAGPVPSPIY